MPALHTVLLGDKDKAAKSKSPLISYNAGHVADLVEPGGGPGGSDRVFESKVVSPCTLADKQGGEMCGPKLLMCSSAATSSASATPRSPTAS